VRNGSRRGIILRGSGARIGQRLQRINARSLRLEFGSTRREETVTRKPEVTFRFA
jgi:hypothetical protein